jgi:hypothetical protein
VGDTAYYCFCVETVHLTRWRHSHTKPLNEQFSVWIEHDFSDFRIVKGAAQVVSQSVLQLIDEPWK